MVYLRMPILFTLFLILLLGSEAGVVASASVSSSKSATLNENSSFQSSAYDVGNPVLEDVWVDPVHGSDLNSGISRVQALRSVAQAWNRIPSGVTLTVGYRILLVGGNYPEGNLPPSGWMASRTGTYQFPVILQSADGALSARLHGYLDVFDCHYLYLLGLDFVTDPGHGGGGDVVHIASSDHILIRGSKLNGFDGHVRAPQETLKVNQAQFVYVEDSEIAGAFWFPLDFVAVQYGDVLNDTIHNSGDDCAVLKGGTAYFRIEGNEIYDCTVIGFSAGQGTGFEYMVSPWLHYEAYDLKFVNNVVHDTQNAGMAVLGGYNILMAYNTLYRVGIDNAVGAALLLVGRGSRGCDGDAAACRSRRDAGGWGPLSVGESGEWIPNRNVYVYNNIFYNPAPVKTMWSHFDIFGPTNPPSYTNVPSPSVADNNLRIRGNMVWNGPPSLPLGAGDTDQGCQTSNPTCNTTQLVADNRINVLEPHLLDVAHDNFRPYPGSSIFTVTTYAIPDFSWDDAPTTPHAPPGDLSNCVPIDRDGNTRAFTSPPGAYAFFSPSKPMQVSILKPSDGDSVRSPVVLSVQVSSGSSVVSGATVKFYLDGVLLTTKTTNLLGKASYSAYPSAGTHTWHATAEKPGYVSGISETRSFTVPSPTALKVALLKPTDTATVTSPATLIAKVTRLSNGAVVAGATVKFYVNGVYSGTACTDTYGKAKLKVTLAPGAYSWYASAELSGYDLGTSPSWHFTV